MPRGKARAWGRKRKAASLVVAVPTGWLRIMTTDVRVVVPTALGVHILQIPAISVAAGSTTNLSSYVIDEHQVVTDSQLLENGGALSTTKLSYSHNSGNFTITGNSAGTVTGLSLEVTY
jgi:hypothetical protein